MKFRKKSVVIEAEQFFSTRTRPPLYYDGNPVRRRADGRFYIETLEGPLSVSEGDWIIRGVKGEFYPCKPDIFALTYESVEAPDAVDPHAGVTPG